MDVSMRDLIQLHLCDQGEVIRTNRSFIVGTRVREMRLRIGFLPVKRLLSVVFN